MATYYYRAVDSKGRGVAGEVQAVSRSAALRSLAAKSLVPLEIATRPRANFKRFLPSNDTARPFGPRLLTLFLQQLSALLRSGMRLDTALGALEGATSGKPAIAEIARLRRGIGDGQSLAEILSERPGQYPDFVIRLAFAGETSGNLATALARAASLLARAQALRQRLVSALTYPAILVIGGVLTALVVVTYVLPKFEPIFRQSGVDLPLSTRILLATSEIAGNLALPGLIAILVGVPLYRLWRRTPSGRYLIDKASLRLPIVGPLLRTADLSRMSIALEELLAGGVPLTEALTVARDIPTNRVLQGAVDAVGRRVRAGASLTGSIAAEALYPPLMTQMLRIGEETGELGAGFGEVGRFLESDLQHKLDQALTYLTPGITLIMGGLVATIIVSVLSAVMKLNDLAF